jgi:gas vesicle protein
MKTTLGLLAGIALGVGIGMLLAPDKGSETRKKLADSAGDFFDKLKSFVNSDEEDKEKTSGKKSQPSHT